MLKCLTMLMAAAVALSIWETVPVVAQTEGANDNMVTQFKGKLKSFNRGVLVVTRDDDTEIMVQPPDDASAFQFVATAKPAFLQRGTMVRFDGTFNQAGVPMAPVTHVEVFQPIGGKVPGHSRENFIPGVHGERGAGREAPQAVAKYKIVGGLMGLDVSGVMMVQAGNRAIRVQLAPDAEFEIRFNSLALAQEGDPVSVAGFYQPPDETKVKAERVTITTDRVYDGSTPKIERTPRRRRGRTEATEDPKDETAKDGDSKEAAESKPEGDQESADAEKGEPE